jgi:hypothetical protein
MLPPALAIGWMIWRQHRSVFSFGLSYVIATAVLANTAVAGELTLTPGSRVFFAALIPPIFALTIVLITVFSYGEQGDLNGPASCFPPSLLTLPVRTAALAGWHLTYGALAISLLWLVTARFILRPWLALIDLSVPLWWPAVLAATFMAWMQALLWLPFGLPGLRIVVAALLLSGLLGLAIILGQLGVPEGVLLALYGGLGAVGWLGAYQGVRCARCGAMPNWERLMRPLRRLAMTWPRRRQPFPTAMAAHVWFEWRRMGRSLPAMTGMILPFMLLPLFLDNYRVFPTSATVLSMLGLPLFLASFSGTTVSGRNPWVKDYYGVPPFTATLPMSTTAMVAAKLKAAAWSTLLTWVLMSVGIAIALNQRPEDASRWWNGATSAASPFQIFLGLFAAAGLLVLGTWKRQVDSLLTGLTGRTWIIVVSVLVVMFGFAALCILVGLLVDHPERRATLLRWVPWLLGGVLLARVLGAGVAVRLALRWRLLKPRLVACWISGELLLAASFFGLLIGSGLAEHTAWYYLALGVLWSMPMASLAAAPVALAWNRHR